MSESSPPDLSDDLRQRRSIRRFRGDPVPRETIDRIMDAVRFSPTPTNRLCFRFLGIQQPLLIESIRQEVVTSIEQVASQLDEESARTFREYSQWFTFFDRAPVLIIGLFRVFSSRLPATGGNMPSLEGIAELQAFGGAIHALLLEAHHHNLGGCWMSGPLIAEDRLLRLLQIEKPWRIGALVPIGFPESQPKAPKKPSVQDMFTWMEN